MSTDFFPGRENKANENPPSNLPSLDHQSEHGSDLDERASTSAVSYERRQLYVSDRGGRRPEAQDVTARSSATTVVTDAGTGATATGTLSIVDLETMTERQLAVGLAPAGLAITPDDRMVAVANAHSDSVTFVDLESLRRDEVTIPAYPQGSFGATPSAIAFSPDGQTAYVTCGGINAISVLRRTAGNRWELKGALPWPGIQRQSPPTEMATCGW